MFPDFEDEAPLERKITKERISLVTESENTTVEFASPELGRPENSSYSVLRGPFDRWLASKAEEAGAECIFGITVEDLVWEDGRIAGVRAGEDEITAEVTILAFVFENEAHDLFGAEIEGIAIDFGGKFYHVAQSEPMTVISPAQKAAREKAEKLAAAKAAKEKGAGTADDMEAKLAGMDPEKAVKVRAAMEAKAKKQAAEAEAAKADKIANLDPEKAAKLKAAMEAKAAREAAKKEQADSAAKPAATDQKEGE